jgi:[acyl-carrier-protein] S-malonyltransferase
MSAIVGLTVEQVDRIVELARAEGVVVAANYNSPVQVVISGEGAAVAAAAQYAKKEKGKAVPLPVSGAWHSPLMDDAAREFAEKLETVSFNPPRAPVYLNVTGRPETDPAKIKDAMTRQIISPVRWAEAVAAMFDHQFDTFVEVGPKNVLGGLVKKTAPKGSGPTVLTCGNLEEIEAAAEKIKAG